jgi:hypothetical protein
LSSSTTASLSGRVFEPVFVWAKTVSLGRKNLAFSQIAFCVMGAKSFKNSLNGPQVGTKRANRDLQNENLHKHARLTSRELQVSHFCYDIKQSNLPYTIV